MVSGWPTPTAIVVAGSQPLRGTSGADDEAAQQDSEGGTTEGTVKPGSGRSPDLAMMAQGRGTAHWDGGFVPCADGRWRVVKPGIQPVVDGLPLAVDGAGPVYRIGTLRGAGNAIVPQVAAFFIRACME